MDRIGRLCSFLSETETFADVGCDHGYVAEHMLRNGLCRRAYVTDISASSLRKAEILLKDYIAEGRCVPIVCDGLSLVPRDVGLVTVAGLGGEEIVKILTRGFLPARFLLQPMKNAEKLRRYLVERGAGIDLDLTFSDGRRYYDVIGGRAAGGEAYTEREFRYGRDNLKGSPEFFSFLGEEIRKTKERLSLARTERSRAALSARLAEMEEIYHGIEKNL